MTTTLTAADKPGWYLCSFATHDLGDRVRYWDGIALSLYYGSAGMDVVDYTNFRGPLVLAPQPEPGGTP